MNRCSKEEHDRLFPKEGLMKYTGFVVGTMPMGELPLQNLKKDTRRVYRFNYRTGGWNRSR